MVLRNCEQDHALERSRVKANRTDAAARLRSRREAQADIEGSRLRALLVTLCDPGAVAANRCGRGAPADIRAVERITNRLKLDGVAVRGVAAHMEEDRLREIDVTAGDI